LMKQGTYEHRPLLGTQIKGTAARSHHGRNRSAFEGLF
jgi:hypothetical protein